MKAAIRFRNGEEAGFYVELYDHDTGEQVDEAGPFDDHDDAFFAAERALELADE